MMKYQKTTIPLSKPFEVFTKADAQEFYEWYVSVIPSRVSHLEELIQENQDSNWVADYSEESLVGLLEYFAKNVKRGWFPLKTVWKMSIAKGYFDLSALTQNISDSTAALALDIGMYLGEYWVRNYKELHWVCAKDKKKDGINYGQPCIGKFEGNVVYNPTHQMMTFAFGVRKKIKNADDYLKVVDFWKKYAPK